MSIITNENRIGNITSSEIVALMSNGKTKGEPGAPFKTYIEETNMERLHGLSISTESNARPLTWGKFLEKRVFNLLGLEYKECSQETILNPEIDYWSGSPDGEKFDVGKTVIDVKCPITRKSFSRLVEPIMKGLSGTAAIDYLRENDDKSKSHEKYYWQLVSNACHTDAGFAELIVYMPYFSELEEIRDAASNLDDPEKQYRYKWIAFANDDELPYLKENHYYKNLNIIRFPVPQSDKNALKERVEMAGKLLIPRRQNFDKLI